uniref:Uncharacterized protein n=1 Tax=Rangifer tarandus platyrhynchus TaxID=3082113 RepID=A0ACB0E9U2_RANTA|nr:unnamed protein product [Rangifer tarandus platyrhynchus]
MLAPSSWPFCASARGSQGKLPLLSRPSLRWPPLHPAARGLGRAQKVPAACPRGPAATLDQRAPRIISSSSPGSGHRRCGDQLGPWSGDPVQGSTLPTTTSAPSARPQSCPSHSFPPTGSGLQQSKRCEPAGRGRAASRACPPAFGPPPAPAPSSRSGLLVRLPSLHQANQHDRA